MLFGLNIFYFLFMGVTGHSLGHSKQFDVFGGGGAGRNME